MSKVEVDQIDPQSGTTLTLGTSGDTIVVPSGVTFNSSAATNTLPSSVVTTTGTQTLTNKSIVATQLTGTITPSDDTVTLAKMAPGTDGNIISYDASGNPVAVATGSAAQVLTSAGAGAPPTFATATVPDNAITLAKMASGTDGNIISYDASGNPVAIATGSDGQVLTSAGAGAQPAFETLPVGGITELDMWRLTTYYTGLQNPINANWERADTSGFSYKGSGLTQSSGVFSFPSTGYWKIDFNWQGNSQTDTRAVGAGIAATENNSSYSDLGYSYTFLQRTQSDATYISVNTNAIFKVDNITTHKIRFFGGASNINAAPDSNAQAVGFTCFKLTDI